MFTAHFLVDWSQNLIISELSQISFLFLALLFMLLQVVGITGLGSLNLSEYDVLRNQRGIQQMPWQIVFVLVPFKKLPQGLDRQSGDENSIKLCHSQTHICSFAVSIHQSLFACPLHTGKRRKCLLFEHWYETYFKLVNLIRIKKRQMCRGLFDGCWQEILLRLTENKSFCCCPCFKIRNHHPDLRLRAGMTEIHDTNV